MLEHNKWSTWRYAMEALGDEEHLQAFGGLVLPMANSTHRPSHRHHPREAVWLLAGAEMDTFQIAISKHSLDHKIPPGDPFWREFNASFVNCRMGLPDLLQAVYDGHPFTTQHKNNWRASENYLRGQHIGLDFDAGDSTSTLAHLTDDKFIMRYGAFVYTTVSHTEEHPRARAIFILDQPIMQAKNYTLAAAALLWLFGTADRQCKDAVRFFYGSKGCQFEYINQVLPLDVVKKLIGEYQASGQREHHRAARSDYHAPASQQEVADALNFIRPWDIDYDEWVSVLMAIHSQFGDAGLSLAENWADGKQGEVEQKWRSFKQNGNPAGAVTIATVFGIAKQHGWRKETIRFEHGEQG